MINYNDIADMYNNSRYLRIGSKIIFNFADLKEKYGKSTVLTYKKLINNKLIILTPLNEMIYKKILDIFNKNFEKTQVISGESEKIQAISKLKIFISCFPNFSQILKSIKKLSFNDEKNKNEIFFIKICLEINLKYYKSEELPHHKVNYE